MAALTLTEVKNYLRVDVTADDAEIQDLMDSAEQYVTNAGVTVDYSNRLTARAVKLYCAWLYDHRADDTPEPPALALTLEQLRHATGSMTEGSE